MDIFWVNLGLLINLWRLRRLLEPYYYRPDGLPVGQPVALKTIKKTNDFQVVGDVYYVLS